MHILRCADRRPCCAFARSERTRVGRSGRRQEESFAWRACTHSQYHTQAGGHERFLFGLYGCQYKNGPVLGAGGQLVQTVNDVLSLLQLEANLMFPADASDAAVRQTSQPLPSYHSELLADTLRLSPGDDALLGERVQEPRGPERTAAPDSRARHRLDVP